MSMTRRIADAVAVAYLGEASTGGEGVQQVSCLPGPWSRHTGGEAVVGHEQGLAATAMRTATL